MKPEIFVSTLLSISDKDQQLDYIYSEIDSMLWLDLFDEIKAILNLLPELSTDLNLGILTACACVRSKLHPEYSAFYCRAICLAIDRKENEDRLFQGLEPASYNITSLKNKCI